MNLMQLTKLFIILLMTILLVATISAVVELGYNNGAFGGVDPAVGIPHGMQITVNETVLLKNVTLGAGGGIGGSNMNIYSGCGNLSCLVANKSADGEFYNFSDDTIYFYPNDTYYVVINTVNQFHLHILYSSGIFPYDSGYFSWEIGIAWNSSSSSWDNTSTTYNPLYLDYRNIKQFGFEPYICTESWIADLGSCLINDTQLLTYHDENACGTTTMLPPQNGTYVGCNYCTISYHSVQSACLNETITTYYVNDNFITCCDVTSIPVDCDLPSNSTISCATGDASLITGLIIDTSVEVGRVWVGFASLIAMIGIGAWVMFII